jgi:hypothetical protein
MVFGIGVAGLTWAVATPRGQMALADLVAGRSVTPVEEIVVSQTAQGRVTDRREMHRISLHFGLPEAALARVSEVVVHDPKGQGDVHLPVVGGSYHYPNILGFPDYAQAWTAKCQFGLCSVPFHYYANEYKQGSGERDLVVDLLDRDGGMLRRMRWDGIPAQTRDPALRPNVAVADGTASVQMASWPAGVVKKALVFEVKRGEARHREMIEFPMEQPGLSEQRPVPVDATAVVISVYCEDTAGMGFEATTVVKFDDSSADKGVRGL